MIVLATLGCRTAPAGAQTPASGPALRPWPASDIELHYVQELQEYTLKHPNPQAQIIGCITIFRTDPDPPRTYRQVLERFRQKSPSAIIGTYISGGGCCKRAAQGRYPADAVEYESLPPRAYTGEIIDGRYTVDVGDPDIADQFADAIVRATTGRGCNFVYLDEIRHPSSGGTRIPWERMTRFMRRIRTGLNAAGMKLVANIAVSPWVLAGPEADLLQDAVDGMSFEMCFEPQWCRKDPERVDAEIGVYRHWLTAGKLILLIPNYDMERVLNERRFMAGMAMLLRERGQPIFVHADYWHSMPNWIDWPAKYGRPRGDRVRTGPTILQRHFEKGTLVVDTAAASVRFQ